jgi:plastocyanin
MKVSVRLKIVYSLLLVMLLLSLMPLLSVQAQDEPRTYVIEAGAYGPQDTGIAVNDFAPRTVTVRRGDIVQWHFNSLHTVNTSAETTVLLITQMFDGQERLQFNPEIVTGDIENGSVFEAGKHSGFVILENGVDTFSLVMDVEPGIYRYHCDLHPGMEGVIVVTDNDEEVLSPEEVTVMGEQQMAAAINNGLRALSDTLDTFPDETEDGVLEVQIGVSSGQTSVHYFFPPIATITVGESVTWTVAPGVEVYTINLPAPREQTDTPTEVIERRVTDEGETAYVLSELLIANTTSGAEITTSSEVRSGILGPDETFTLTFTEPGTYVYFSAIHGVRGAIIVNPER